MMVLQPQDLVVLLKLSLWEEKTWTNETLAALLYLRVSDVRASVQRTLAAKLLGPATMRPYRRNLLNFLIYGSQFVFIPQRGGLTWGFPTSYAAPPLRDEFIITDEILPVWPHPQGTIYGERIEPLYPTAVQAALEDEGLYECLALVDALRIGRAREHRLATEILTEAL